MDHENNPNIILKPITLNSFLSDEEIQKYETSNSIIASHTFFENIINNNIYSTNMLLLALFRNDIKIFVDIDASHYDDDNIMYVPLWIYQYLKCTEDDENVNHMQICPQEGNKIKIKPHSDFYAYLPDPVEALRNAFEKYSVLVKNTTIPLMIENRILYVDILDTHTANAPICIRGVELEVEIEEINTTPAVPAVPIVPIENTTAIIINETNNETYDQKKFPGKGYSLR